MVSYILRSIQYLTTENSKSQQNSQSNGHISQPQEWRNIQSTNVQNSGVGDPQSYIQPSPDKNVNNEKLFKNISQLDNKRNDQYNSVRQVRVGKSNRIANSDGYTWRKYGEKSVRGSKFPRHYYKCNFQGCSARKICAFDTLGQCLYLDVKGNHIHPPISEIKNIQNGQQRSSFVQGQDENKAQNQVKLSKVFRNVKNYPQNNAPRLNKGKDNSEQFHYGLGQGACGAITSPVKPDTHFSDDINFNNLGQSEGMVFGSLSGEGCQSCHGPCMCPQDFNQIQSQQDYPPDFSNSNFQNPSQGYIMNSIMNVDNQKILQQYNSNGKQMYIVEAPMDQNSFNDGYRYRKYGCKSVKDNLFPRNYYRCIEPGCNVRRLIERWPKDVQFLMVTYEGIHNHNHALQEQLKSQKKRKASQDEEYNMFNFDFFK